MMAVAVVLFAAGLSAQGKPSFTGKWTLQVDPNAAPAGGGGGGRGGGRGGGGWGAEFTATQDATTLKIERTVPAGGTAPAPENYKLDGSESKNQMAMGGGGRGGAGGGGGVPPAPMEVVSKATWVGNTIQIVSSQSVGGNTIETKRVLSIGADGVLTIETTRPGQDGTPQTTKAMYKKG
jgi:hypothetical protein